MLINKNNVNRRSFTSSIQFGQLLEEGEKMKFEAYRLQSFEHWQDYDNARPTALAKNGFFYCDNSDIVTCFSCGVQKGQWSYRSKPEVEHRRLNPNCLHIQGQDNENIPIFVPNDEEEQEIRTDLHNTYCSDDTVDFQIDRNSDNKINNSETNNRINQPSLPVQLNITPSINSTLPNSFPKIHRSAESRIIEPTEQNDALKFLSEAERLKTFEGVWPHNTPTPTQLSNCGFIYTGTHDRVQCVFCNGILRSWESFDIPIEEHRKHFPSCPMINNVNVGNIPVMGAVLPGLSTHAIFAGPAEVADFSEVGCHITDPNLINNIDLISATGIHTERPRHPEYATEASRIATFRNWPCGISQTPQQLAKAGFYYAGFDDSVKCFFCDGGLRTWDPEDDPWKEHAKWFSRCSYVLQVKGPAYVQQFKNTDCSSASATVQTEEREILARMDLPVVQKVLAMDIPRDRIMSVIRDRLQNAGDDFPDIEALLNAIYHSGDVEQNSCSFQSEVLEIPTAQSELTPYKNETLEIQDQYLMSGLTDSNDHESLLLENQRLKEQRTCKICMDEEANIVLLPCGHLVSCGTCAPALRKCPICRGNIKGTVRTYLS